MTTSTAPVKARKKAIRKIRVVSPATDATPAIVRIEAGRKVALYAVAEIPNELGNGRAFQVKEISTTGQTETYSCIATGDEATCDCHGHQRYGFCKHRDGLFALILRRMI